MAGNVQGRMPREAGRLSVLIDKELMARSDATPLFLPCELMSAPE